MEASSFGLRPSAFFPPPPTAAYKFASLAMATAGAGFAGVSLAEAYVMRSLHKEKMKKMENKEKEAKSEKMKKMESKEKEAKSRDDHKVFDEKNNPATGCFFFRVSKKTHSAKFSSADSTEKPV